MPSLKDVLDTLGNEQLRTATLLGLASIPFAIAVNWTASPDSVSGTPLIVAATIAGCEYRTRPIKSPHAGGQAALVGSIPILVWWTVHTAIEFASALEGAAFGVGLVVIVLGMLLMTFVGIIGGAIGGWSKGLITRVQPTGAES
ncbi:MAG: DUF5518 domain-containing protein [Euryarchaeota archaeon]|nr:DUF5518 domain-containing protein [Euryarchaeota archaeon]